MVSLIYSDQKSQATNVLKVELS